MTCPTPPPIRRSWNSRRGGPQRGDVSSCTEMKSLQPHHRDNLSPTATQPLPPQPTAQHLPQPRASTLSRKSLASLPRLLGASEDDDVAKATNPTSCHISFPICTTKTERPPSQACCGQAGQGSDTCSKTSRSPLSPSSSPSLLFLWRLLNSRCTEATAS